MKFFSLSTTAKVYLLTLLFLTIIISINKAVFAHTSESEKRIKTMQLYQSWINTGEYGEFKTDLGKSSLSSFEEFLNTKIAEDQSCLNPSQNQTQNQPQENSFIGNIQTFFSALIQKTSGQDQTSSPLTECKAKIKADYKIAKKYNRLLKFLQIQDGKPNLCVKADLGVGTALTAKGFNPAKVKSDNPKESGRTDLLPVYLCTGNDGGKKVRVVDDSGTRLRLAPEEATKAALQVSNLPPAGSLEKLIEKINTTN